MGFEELLLQKAGAYVKTPLYWTQRPIVSQGGQTIKTTSTESHSNFQGCFSGFRKDIAPDRSVTPATSS